jgi:hypothetical protein
MIFKKFLANAALRARPGFEVEIMAAGCGVAAHL